MLNELTQVPTEWGSVELRFPTGPLALVGTSSDSGGLKGHGEEPWAGVTRSDVGVSRTSSWLADRGTSGKKKARTQFKCQDMLKSKIFRKVAQLILAKFLHPYGTSFFFFLLPLPTRRTSHALWAPGPPKVLPAQRDHVPTWRDVQRP